MFQSKALNVLFFIVGIALEGLVHVQGVGIIDTWGGYLANLGAALLLLTNVRRVLPGKAE